MTEWIAWIEPSEISNTNTLIRPPSASKLSVPGCRSAAWAQSGTNLFHRREPFEQHEEGQDKESAISAALAGSGPGLVISGSGNQVMTLALSSPSGRPASRSLRRQQPAVREHDEPVLRQSRGSFPIGVPRSDDALGDDLPQQAAATLAHAALELLLPTDRRPVGEVARGDPRRGAGGARSPASGHGPSSSGHTDHDHTITVRLDEPLGARVLVDLDSSPAEVLDSR
jgi:hypothetical protein